MNDPTITELPDIESVEQFRDERLWLVIRGDVPIEIAKDWNGLGVRVGRS